jgi:hypothetical protein
MLRRVEFRIPHSGVRATGTEPAPEDVLARCAELAPRLRPWQFFSHETALLALGAPMPPYPHHPSVHVSARRPAREPRIAGVQGHRLQLRANAADRAPNGLIIEHPVRAWRQAGTLWRLDDLVAAADYLVSGPAPLASLSDLHEEIDAMGDVPGRLLRRALFEARVGPRSPQETRLRLTLTRAGLPEPEITWNLMDAHGGFLAELDLAYPRWRVALEYDGRPHAENATQFAKDADRWDAIRAAGWDHVRILKHHMRDGGDAAVRKVRDALIRAGWRPER